MAAEQQPNFILRGIRRTAEVTLPFAILGVGIGLFIPVVFGLSAGVGLANGVALGMIKKSRGVA